MTAKEWSSDLVPFGITVCGVDELPDFAARDVSHVLSILDVGMTTPDAFSRYPAHARLDLRFSDRIKEEPGSVLVQRADVDLLLAFGRDLTAEPKDAHLLVHCQMGVSRSTASMLLIMAQARPDLGPDALVKELVRIRPQAWPNLRVMKLGDDLLGRKGTLVSAVRGIYQARVAKQPELAALFRSVGREEEVDG